MPYILESGCEGHKKNGLLSCLAIWFRYTDQICMISIHRHWTYWTYWTYWTSQYSADWRGRSHEGSGELRLPAKLVQVSTRGKYWWKRLGKPLGKRLDKKVKYWDNDEKHRGAVCPMSQLVCSFLHFVQFVYIMLSKHLQTSQTQRFKLRYPVAAAPQGSPGQRWLELRLRSTVKCQSFSMDQN